MTDFSALPAYGGPGWTPRQTALREELGSHWGSCGIDSEWQPLEAVLLHRPGRELEACVQDPANSLMRFTPDTAAIQLQHDAMAQAYRERGVAVHYVAPSSPPPPNQLFAADLMAMTPEGAILGRPASEVRAGEERWVGRALGDLGIPIIRSVRGGGTFEGADLMWITPHRAILGEGLRTNAEGAAQVKSTLEEMGASVVITRLPRGTMHLMGQLRIVDRDLAIGWRGRLPDDAVQGLAESGVRVSFLPDERESQIGFALNFVVLGPREVLMPAGNPHTQAFYQGLGITCHTVDVGEIGKAAGSIGCLTGILKRTPTAEGKVG
jgi:N-dimethylarginine dimethylaminohydrolase